MSLIWNAMREFFTRLRLLVDGNDQELISDKNCKFSNGMYWDWDTCENTQDDR